MNNYLHKITIIFVLLCFSSFILHNREFFSNTENYSNFEIDTNESEEDTSKEDTSKEDTSKEDTSKEDTSNDNEDTSKEDTSNDNEDTSNKYDMIKIDKKFQTYGSTNHQDPNDMSQEQQISFKYSYPNNMTLQDYVNWLLLYKDEQRNLSKEHVINLQKLLVGEQLEYIAGILPPPTKISPPLTSKDYFNNLYLANTTIKNPRIYNITNSTSGDMMPFNYYSDFNDNFDVYGTSGRYDLNPDLFRKKDLKNFKVFTNSKLNKYY